MKLEHSRNQVRQSRMVTIVFVGTIMLCACNSQPTPSATQDLGSIAPEKETVVVEPTKNRVTEEMIEKDTSVETSTPLPTEGVIENGQVLYGLTNHKLDGNRWVEGSGMLPEIEPLNIPLKGVPIWVVGAPVGEGSLWVVVLEDGQIEAFHVVDGEVSEVSLEPERLSPGAPPLLMIKNGIPTLITVADTQASPYTHPTVLDSQGSMAYITKEGDLALWAVGGVESLALSALPDSRILINDTGDLLLLNRATDRYGHGVLGDTIEAAAIVFVDMNSDTHDVLEILIPEPAVIEGIAPIWVDIDGDGELEIIVTISDAKQGAQFVVYDEQGGQVATSEPIGRGYRWRHQIAVAPLGPEGQMELVSVRTPHIGGVVEFHRLEGEDLRLVASISGYTTHVIGSRNLDMSVAGDFDGDGKVEILVPDQSLSRLAGLQRISGGVEEAWSLPLNGTLNTNLATISDSKLDVAVGVGLRQGFLRLWMP